MIDTVLQMNNITKIYENGFAANKEISFDLRKGEIHALAGENGAGKTTLMKILFGLEQATEGEILINGKPVVIRDPLDAIKQGLGMVHQHFMQIPSMTVAENVVLGMEPKNGIVFDTKSAEEMTQKIANQYRFNIDAGKRIRDLSIAQKQKVEIIKTLIRGAKIIILDEPTAVLTPQESQELFEQMRILKKEGHSIIFITHKLEEIFQVCDRVTIIRNGNHIATKDISDTSIEEMTLLMVGRDIHFKQNTGKKEKQEYILEIRNISYTNQDKKKVVDDISIHISKGEIVGIAGIEGNGQSELAEIISGLLAPDEGEILIDHQKMPVNIALRRSAGLSYISEDRFKNGCASEMSVRENLIANRLYDERFMKNGHQRTRQIRQFVKDCIKEYEIACRSEEEKIGMLSGGNIQKTIVARELSFDPKVIIANQPTRGVDIGASELIRRKIIECAENGACVLLVSSDLAELFQISSRLLVMNKGRIVAEFTDCRNLDRIEVGEYMLGLKEMEYRYES